MLKKIIKIVPFILIFFILSAGYATPSSMVQKDGIFTYVIEEGAAIITNVDDTQKTVVVPSQLDGCPVTTLAGGSFGGSVTIEEVFLPDSITTIESMCFSYCTKLSQITLPQNLTEIDAGVFNHCTNLRSIELPSGIKNIGKNAFYRCDELWTISLPESVVSVEENAFASCPALSAVTIPNPKITIHDSAFEKSNILCIYAKPNTTAEQYARANDIAYEELITVSVNGTPVQFDQPPITDKENFRTLVPMRSVMTSLNGSISWDDNTKTAGIILPDYHIFIQIGEPYMTINGEIKPTSSIAIEYNNRTLLPIRNIIESIGGNVLWDEDNKHIDVIVESNLFH